MFALLQSQKLWAVIGALLGGLAVAMGAYGWHSLEADEAMRDIFMLAVQYHMWHALALQAVAWRCSTQSGTLIAGMAGLAFTIGILLFSFNLYGFAMTGEVIISGAAPVGGFSLMAGWVLLAASVFIKR